MNLSKIFKNAFLIILASLVLSACATQVKKTSGQMQGDVDQKNAGMAFSAGMVMSLLDRLALKAILKQNYHGCINQLIDVNLNLDNLHPPRLFFLMLNSK